jgi:hypothetical protein
MIEKLPCHKHELHFRFSPFHPVFTDLIITVYSDLGSHWELLQFAERA